MKTVEELIKEWGELTGGSPEQYIYDYMVEQMRFKTMVHMDEINDTEHRMDRHKKTIERLEVNLSEACELLEGIYNNVEASQYGVDLSNKLKDFLGKK